MPFFNDVIANLQRNQKFLITNQLISFLNNGGFPIKLYYQLAGRSEPNDLPVAVKACVQRTSTKSTKKVIGASSMTSANCVVSGVIRANTI